MPDETWMIEAQGLTKRFGERTAVGGVDLRIRKGEVFGLLGPNGAGKTTTINMLTTILRATEGKARVNGFDVHRQPAKVRRSIGIVFQDPSIDGILTGRENLLLHGRLYGVPPAKLKQRVEEMLELVGLEKRGDDLARTYSGGMKRRLEIARGLMHDPAVLFLDEPTIGLDPATREHIWEYIRKLVRERSTTVVITTHYMEEADALCDRIAIVDHGKIVALDTPAALKASLGGDTVLIKQGNTDPGAFEKLPFVKSMEETQAGEVVLTVENAAENLQQIVQHAGKIERIEVRTPTLEDVFIHLTGREIRDSVEEGDGVAEQILRMQNNG